MARNNVLEFIIEATDKVSPVLSQIFGKFGSLVTKVTSGSLGIVSAFAAIGGAALSMARSAAIATNEVGELAEKAGIGVESFSRLNFAAQRADISTGTLTSGIARLTQRISDATKGLGGAAEAFQTLNISAHDLSQLAPDQQLLAIADAISKVSNRGQQLDLLKDIFGRDASSFLKLLNDGSAGIRKLGGDLDRLGGTITASQAAAAKKYTESMEDLSISFQGLKRSLLDTGLIEGMTKFNNEMARLVASQSGADPAGRVQVLTAAIEGFKKVIAENRDVRTVGLAKGSMAIAQKELDALLLKQGEAISKSVELQGALTKIGGADITPLDFTNNPLLENRQHTVNFDTTPFQEWYASLSELETRTTQELAFLNEAIVKGLIIDPVDQERIRKSILEAGGLAEELAPKQRDTFLKDMTEDFDFMEQAAERAAQNMQDSFAEFFMNMGSGLDDLLKSFINVMRRMLAEALAFRAMKFLGVDSFFDKLAGRASGGGVTAGTPYMVGERGPELFVPGNSGKVMPNSALGNTGNGAHYTTNIDARGADPGLIARLPAILEQRDRRLMLAVQRFAETGIMPT